jgi:hypothetical protein
LLRIEDMKSVLGLAAAFALLVVPTFAVDAGFYSIQGYTGDECTGVRTFDEDLPISSQNVPVKVPIPNNLVANQPRSLRIVMPNEQKGRWIRSAAPLRYRRLAAESLYSSRTYTGNSPPVAPARLFKPNWTTTDAAQAEGAATAVPTRTTKRAYAYCFS